MNRERRKRLEKVITNLEELRDELMCLQEEEQEAFDNMPESLQESERGEQISENADTFEEAYNDIDNVIDSLSEIE